MFVGRGRGRVGGECLALRAQRGKLRFEHRVRCFERFHVGCGFRTLASASTEVRFEIDRLACEFGAQHEPAHRGRGVQFRRGRGFGIECFETGRQLLLPVALGDAGFEQGFTFFERRAGGLTTRLEFRAGFGRGPAAPDQQRRC